MILNRSYIVLLLVLGWTAAEGRILSAQLMVPAHPHSHRRPTSGSPIFKNAAPPQIPIGIPLVEHPPGHLTRSIPSGGRMDCVGGRAGWPYLQIQAPYPPLWIRDFSPVPFYGIGIGVMVPGEPRHPHYDGSVADPFGYIISGNRMEGDRSDPSIALWMRQNHLVPTPSSHGNPSPSAILRQASQFKASTPQDQQEARIWNERGDRLSAEGNFNEAANAYRRSVDIASDQSDSRLKLGVLLALLKRYREAGHEFRASLGIDPQIVERSPSLNLLVGEDRELSIHDLLQSAAQWAREDIRDPERLLVIGTLLLLNDNFQQAAVPLRSAERLSPRDPQISQLLLSLNQRARQGRNPAPPESEIGGPTPAPIIPPNSNPVAVSSDSPQDATVPQPVPKRLSDPRVTPASAQEKESTPTRESKSLDGISIQNVEDQPAEAPQDPIDGPLFPEAMN